MLESELVGEELESHTLGMSPCLRFPLSVFFFAGALASLGCSGSSSEGKRETDSGDGDTIGEGNGQTGGIGEAECFDDADCDDVLDLWLSEFSMPGGYVPEFTDAICEQAAVFVGSQWVEGGACACSEGAESGSRFVGPVGLSCYQNDRAGNCIFPGEEFSGCIPSSIKGDDLCLAECEKLEQRMAEAAELTYETEARYAKCENFNCTTVSRVGDICHVNHNTNYEYSHACSLTDEELIAEYIEARDAAQ